MKQLFFCLLLATFISCNSNDKTSDKESSTGETTGKRNSEFKDGISDYTNNKSSFMLTCHIDAANSLKSEKEEQIDNFCECAWEKTGGKYPGEVVANDSKLEIDPVLKGCFEAARTK
ncbi:MAG: hypothetical protein JWR72_657 [Flavisolibacter sp.]|nr:hypothetical protein [Flavisolibacter sp.]